MAFSAFARRFSITQLFVSAARSIALSVTRAVSSLMRALTFGLWARSEAAESGSLALPSVDLYAARWVLPRATSLANFSHFGFSSVGIQFSFGISSPTYLDLFDLSL